MHIITGSHFTVDCDEGTLAYASHCMIDISGKNRPVAGYINLCPLVRPIHKLESLKILVYR